MAYTARQLITRAFYLSQVYSRTLQTISGADMEEGLQLLNAILSFKSVDLRLIPYYSSKDIATVQGQEIYPIPTLLLAETLTFNYQTIRFAINKQGRVQYQGQSRANNILSLPFSCHVERCLNGSNLFLYFLPIQVFVVTIWGKFALTPVLSFDDDLSLSYDLFYIEYLRYALAQYMCSEYAYTFPAEAAMKFKEIVAKVTDPSPADLTVQKSSYFSNGSYINYAVTNLSYGYLPN